MDKEHMQEWLAAVNITERLGNLDTGQQQYDFFSSNPEYSDDEDDNSVTHSQDSSTTSEGEVDEYMYMNMESNENYSGLRQRYSDYEHDKKGHNHNKSEYRSNNHRVEERVIPKWFIDRPFEHNSKVFFIALPGALMMLLLTGEMLLSIGCIGGLVLYLFENAGFHAKALTAYLVTYGVIVLCVFYACVPLLWKSVFNIILLLAMTSYTTLTGSWILLNFAEFRKREPELCTLIEVSLFTVYPLISIVLVSWITVNMTSIKIGPYVIMAFGYPVIQNFLQPTLSSFYKAPKGKPEDNYILQPIYSSVILLIFSFYPLFVFLLHTLYKGNVFTVNNCVESLFIVTANMFFTTVLGAGPIVEQCDIPDRYRINVSWGSVITVILTLPLVLYNHGYHSALLPWLSVILFLHTGFGYSLCIRKNQIVVFCFGGGLFCVYSAIFYFLPWSINYYIVGGIHISMIFGLLYTNFILTLECVLAYCVFSPDELGLSVILQTILFISTQKIMEAGMLLCTPVVLCSSTAAVFVFIKLFHWKKLPVEHVEVCVCLHMAVILTSTLEVVNKTEINVLKDSINFILLSFLILVLNRHLIIQKQKEELSLKEYLRTVLVVIITTIINLLIWLPRIFTAAFGFTTNISDYLGILLLVTSAVLWRLSSRWKWTRFATQSSFFLAVAIIFIQPNIDITWENSVRWMAMGILSQLLCINKLFLYMKKSNLLLFCLSLSTGFPVGLIICELLQIISDIITVITVAFICVVLVAVLLCVWLESSQMEKQVFAGTGVLTVLICMVLLLTYFNKHYMSLFLILLLMTSLSLSSIFKLHSLRNQIIHLTKDGDVKISKLPMIGNVCTLIAMFTSCVFSPWLFEYWVPTCSSILILLQEDHYLLKSNFREKHNLTPTLIMATASVGFFTVYHSHIWSTALWSAWLSGLLELFICVFILPVFINYWTILWNNKFYISDYYTAFVLPLHLILILVGSSYMAYCLCISGISIGSWLMKEKLPLLR